MHPKLEYAAAVWNPYIKTQCSQLEKVHLQVLEEHKPYVDDMLDELQWLTLEARREKASLVFFHKIHYGLVDIDKAKYLD